MKVEFIHNSASNQWTWIIKESNGLGIAWGRYYTYKSSAKRGLKRFLAGMKITGGAIELDGDIF